MTDPLRIGNAYGFWGDRTEAAAEMLAREPDLDYLTLDFLAEVSMSILAMQQTRDAKSGYPRDFLDVIESLVPYWSGEGKCRLISNAGGLDPLACAMACRELLKKKGCPPLTIGVITGDNVLGHLQSDFDDESNSELWTNLDTGETIDAIYQKLVTANVYLGARGIVEALQQKADIVITGRTADPSLTVAPCIYHHGWSWDNYDRLAGATIAGHLIECGTQVCGGIATDWLEVPDPARIGYPIVEMSEDGSCVVTKTSDSGGIVNEQTVKEQLMYEIGDPGNYLSPDVTVSFLSLSVDDHGENRVRVCGASGRMPPETYKVSATYHDGYRAEASLTIVGNNSETKAERAAEVVLARVNAGTTLKQYVVELVGSNTHGGAFARKPVDSEFSTTIVRIAVGDDSRKNVERFCREIMPLITGGPQGTTGYSEGRPRIHENFRFWPCLIDRTRVHHQIQLLSV